MIKVHEVLFVFRENEANNLREFPKHGYETAHEAADARDHKGKDYIIVTYYFVMNRIHHNLWIDQQTVGSHG